MVNFVFSRTPNTICAICFPAGFWGHPSPWISTWLFPFFNFTRFFSGLLALVRAKQKLPREGCNYWSCICSSQLNRGDLTWGVTLWGWNKKSRFAHSEKHTECVWTVYSQEFSTAPCWALCGSPLMPNNICKGKEHFSFLRHPEGFQIFAFPNNWHVQRSGLSQTDLILSPYP